MTVRAAARGVPHRGGVGVSTAPLPLVGLVLGYLAIVVAYPAWHLVETAFRGEEGALSLRFVADVLTAPGLVGATRNSLVVSVATTVGATALGASLAWLVGRTDVPGRRALRWALLTPFVIPPFVGAIAWLQLLGGAGWINLLAREYLPFVERSLWNVRGEAGIVFVLTLTSYPLAYITVLGALNRLDPSMEESARASGASVRRTLRDVTLPVMRPAVMSGAILVFIYSMANFGVPAVLGFTENYFVLTTRIYDLIRTAGTAGNLNRAAALSLLLALIAVVAVGLQRWGAGRQRGLSQRSAPDVPLRLGSGRLPLGMFAWTVVVVAGVLPLAAITLGSLTDVLGRLPLPGNLTLEHYVRSLTLNDAVLRGIRNSLILAFIAGLIIVFLGAIIGYLSRRTQLPGRQLLDAAATFPFALPGTVVAVATLMAFISPLGPLVFFNTLWIILLAYLLHYMAYGVRATTGALALMDPSLEEASRVCGASRGTTFWRIVVPMLRPALFGGFFLVFIPTLRELTISVLLWSPGNETIGVVVFSLQDAGETQAAAAVAVVMLLTVAVMNFAARRLSGGRLGY
jgi:iron(III) transport system permease protein